MQPRSRHKGTYRRSADPGIGADPPSDTHPKGFGLRPSKAAPPHYPRRLSAMPSAPNGTGHCHKPSAGSPGSAGHPGQGPGYPQKHGNLCPQPHFHRPHPTSFPCSYSAIPDIRSHRPPGNPQEYPVSTHIPSKYPRRKNGRWKFSQGTTAASASAGGDFPAFLPYALSAWLRSCHEALQRQPWYR